jgi:hypothetical protein
MNVIRRRLSSPDMKRTFPIIAEATPEHELGETFPSASDHKLHLELAKLEVGLVDDRELRSFRPSRLRSSSLQEPSAHGPDTVHVELSSLPGSDRV